MPCLLHRRAADLLRAHDIAHVQAKVGGLMHKVVPRTVINDVRARDNPHERSAKDWRIGAAEDDRVVVIVGRCNFVCTFGGQFRKRNLEISWIPAARSEILQRVGGLTNFGSGQVALP